MNGNNTQQPPTLQTMQATIQALDAALTRQEQRVTKLIAWLKNQFQEINQALDRLDAPPATDEAPALTEIRDRLARIEDYLSQEPEFKAQPPR